MCIRDRLFSLSFSLLKSFHLQTHPLEKRIAYINGINDIKKIDDSTFYELQQAFDKHPLVIFKGVNQVAPNDFLNFVKLFDKRHDTDALLMPDNFPHQMLQPFDQFPDCKHVAPRGNFELIDFHNIKHINVEPTETFINNYVWHTDILGHEYKLPNVVTGFYIIEQPLIGGDTDFISGETVYENLNKEEQLAAQNMLIQINRRKFIINSVKTDYAGVNRLEDYTEHNDGNTQLPLVYAPDNETANEKPKVLIMPTFFEKVVGWSVPESRTWIKTFMCNKVLPYRISIQWKKGDLAVFNNRRFMHSSTPARNYLDNVDSSKRLLLQTFIPTTKPLLCIKPDKQNVYACYNVNWINDAKTSIISTHNAIKFAKNRIGLNSKVDIKINNDNYYIYCQKRDIF